MESMVEKRRERKKKKHFSSNAPHKIEHSSLADEFVTHLSYLAATASL